jgi:hypothetical protein
MAAVMMQGRGPWLAIEHIYTDPDPESRIRLESTRAARCRLRRPQRRADGVSAIVAILVLASAANGVPG